MAELSDLSSANAQARPSLFDAFEHAVLFISLYIMSTSIGSMLHTFVDMLLSAEGSRASKSLTNEFASLGLTISTGFLIISYPIFAFLFLHITKKTMQNPILRSLKSRKILIYFTLVITFLIGLSHVLFRVIQLLTGDMSINVVLHTIITLTIVSTIFAYYLHETREDRRLNV